MDRIGVVMRNIEVKFIKNTTINVIRDMIAGGEPSRYLLGPQRIIYIDGDAQAVKKGSSGYYVVVNTG